MFNSKQVAAFAVFMGFAGMVFFYIGVSMGWLYVSHILTVKRHPTYRAFMALIDICT